MFYISSGCEHPEIVLKWIDYLFSDEGSRFASYGTEGKTYTLDKDQNPVFTDLILHNSVGLTFYQALKKEGMSYICEVKKASPSKGIIAEAFPYLQIAREYEQAGALE